MYQDCVLRVSKFLAVRVSFFFMWPRGSLNCVLRPVQIISVHFSPAHIFVST